MEDQTSAEGGPSLHDASSFRALYEENLAGVYGYFLNRCGGDVAVAEDLTQETFLSAVREIRKGSRITHPAAWIRGIARHKLLDYLRAKARNRMKLVQLELEEADATVAWDPESGHGTAVTALAAVHETQRAALVLRYLDGLSVPEVADALGKTIAATESLLARGRQSFRRCYEEASRE